MLSYDAWYVSYDMWCIPVALSVVALVLFIGCRRPVWRNLLALRLVLCSYLVLLIQGSLSSAVAGGTWMIPEMVVFLLSFVAWLWGGVLVMVRRSSRYRALTLTCWAVYLLLGILGSVA